MFYTDIGQKPWSLANHNQVHLLPKPNQAVDGMWTPASDIKVLHFVHSSSTPTSPLQPFYSLT